MSARLSALILATPIVLFASPASSYTIATGFTESCHEMMTLSTFFGLEVSEELRPDLEIPIPKSDSWRKISDALSDASGLTFTNETERLIAISLALGVRSPDTEGHSVANLASLREAHTNPAGQYPHFLRSTLDDDDEGNIAAIEGSRQHFRDTIQIATAYTRFPTDAQIITTQFYTDFYGQIDVEVWAPMFYLGVAIHALQDSFSHTVRSDDLMKIRHVMNYLEAINTDHKPSRDGIAHSDAMDDCQDSAKEIAETAKQATGELIIVTATIIRQNNVELIDGFMDKWFAYEPGCNAENDFCKSKWSSLAQSEPTGPFIADIFDCTQVRLRSGSKPAPLALMTGFAMFMWVRQRRRRDLKRG